MNHMLFAANATAYFIKSVKRHKVIIKYKAIMLNLLLQKLLLHGNLCAKNYMGEDTDEESSIGAYFFFKP